MEKEAFFTGYCRTLDESRMVCAVQENGTLLEVDCAYTVCPYTPQCPIAQSIRDLLKEEITNS